MASTLISKACGHHLGGGWFRIVIVEGVFDAPAEQEVLREHLLLLVEKIWAAWR